MKTYFKLILIISVLGVSACTTDTPETKSPCVGIEGSPCERRNPALNHA